MDANLTSVYYCMRHKLPVMAEQGRGAILNNASVLGLVDTPGLAPYVAAKHAVVGLTRATALEYVQTGIRINAIAPAGVDTPQYRATMGADPQTAEAFRAMHRLGALPPPRRWQACCSTLPPTAPPSSAAAPSPWTAPGALREPRRLDAGPSPRPRTARSQQRRCDIV